MRLRVRFLASLAILLPALLWSRGFASSQEASGADPIADNLQRARAQHTAAVEKLRGELLEAFEAAIKTVARSGDLEAVKAVIAEKEAFGKTGAVPESPAVKRAADRYSRARREADAKLVEAYETAVGAYTRDLEIDKASSVQDELKAILAGGHDGEIRIWSLGE